MSHEKYEYQCNAIRQPYICNQSAACYWNGDAKKCMFDKDNFLDPHTIRMSEPAIGLGCEPLFANDKTRGYLCRSAFDSRQGYDGLRRSREGDTMYYNRLARNASIVYGPRRRRLSARAPTAWGHQLYDGMTQEHDGPTALEMKVTAEQKQREENAARAARVAARLRSPDEECLYQVPDFPIKLTYGYCMKLFDDKRFCDKKCLHPNMAEKLEKWGV